MSDIGVKNDCCGDSALFSPEHRIGIYTLLVLYTVFYIVSVYSENLLAPLIEVIMNSFLIFGLIINIVLCVHINETEFGFPLFYWFFGNIPIILLLLIELSKKQKLIKNHIELNDLSSNNIITKGCLYILRFNPFIKYPILTIILVPIIILLSLFVMLFGQKPDSIIRAFTDTYKHGFSQLNHMCDNVECGFHFLCSVGAKGHQKIVKPIRYGERNGNKIICNRQLLISNAFEELIENKFPKIHSIIRHHYNKVGNAIHKHYHFFDNEIVSDVVYILMKPLEFIFLLTLYSFDKNPENRIAKQYLSKADKEKINESYL